MSDGSDAPDRGNLFEALSDWHSGVVRMGALAAEAQSVVVYRVLGFAGFWSVPPSEAVRMTAEKAPAFFESWVGASEAAGRGASFDAVVTAFAEPLEKAAQSNRQRLERRGPRLGYGFDPED